MAKKKTGPRGGVKHTPGRDHNSKSGPQRKKRFRKKVAKIRQTKEADLKMRWDDWDALPPEVQKLRPELKRREPRPTE